MRELSEATMGAVEEALEHHAEGVELYDEDDPKAEDIRDALTEFREWRAERATVLVTERDVLLSADRATVAAREKATEPGECEWCGGAGTDRVHGGGVAVTYPCSRCHGTGKRKGGE